MTDVSEISHLDRLLSEQRIEDVLTPLIRLVRPPPLRHSWQWADEKRVLPRESAEPGPWNTGRAPWVKGPSAAISAPTTDFVTVVCGSQMSKTDGIILNDIGHTYDEDPRPCLYVGPTQKNVQSLSADRFKKMIASVPDLSDAMAKGHKDKIVEKFINGVRLGFGWAGSATELASHPVYKVYMDERDRMDDIPGEGSVDEIVEARVSTYNGIVITTSTPLLGDVERETNTPTGLSWWKVGDTQDIASPTWQLWQEGSRHEWAFPCPDCSEYFIPWSGLLYYDENATPQEVFYKSFLACPHCGTLIENKSKEGMNNRGVFVAPGQSIEPTNWNNEGLDYAKVDNEKVEFGGYLDTSISVQHISFWISGLCSNWRTFGNRARQFARAKLSGSDARLQGAVNTGYGELYMPRGEAPDWHVLLDLRQGYRKGGVPRGALVLTAGVDVQADRLYFVVRGWGPNWDSFLIDNGEIMGDTKHPHVWNELARVLEASYDRRVVQLMLIDSGFKPNEGPAASSVIYKFCFDHSRALPSKGHDKRTRTHMGSKINVTVDGALVKDGLTLWHLDSDYFKSMVYDRIEWPNDQLGGFHLHSDVEEEYCRQVVSESRVVLATGSPKWVQLRRDNHYLDCEVGALAAAHILGLHRLTEDMLKDDKPAEGRKVLHGGLHG